MPYYVIPYMLSLSHYLGLQLSNTKSTSYGVELVLRTYVIVCFNVCIKMLQINFFRGSLRQCHVYRIISRRALWLRAASSYAHTK